MSRFLEVQLFVTMWRPVCWPHKEKHVTWWPIKGTWQCRNPGLPGWCWWCWSSVELVPDLLPWTKTPIWKCSNVVVFCVFLQMLIQLYVLFLIPCVLGSVSKCTTLNRFISLVNRFSAPSNIFQTRGDLRLLLSERAQRVVKLHNWKGNHV